MITNTTISDINHSESATISKLKSADALPFSGVLSTEMISKSMEGTEYRERFFTPDITMWALLSQALDNDKSQQNAVARVNAFFVSQGKEPPSANTSAYSQARSRLPEDVISNLSREVAKQMEQETPSDWRWRNRNIKLIDGSTVSMPDTPENQEIYPQPDSQKAGVGFPIARIVAVIDYATGVVTDLAIGPYSGKQTGEHALLRQLMDVFKAGDIVLGDCYYASFFLLAKLIELGIDAVFPIHNARKHDFRTGNRIGKKDHIVLWEKPAKPEWMSQEEYDQFPDEIKIREISIENKRDGFRTKKRTLVTTFLDHQAVEKSDLEELYNYRWFVELSLRSIKETMRMDILRGKTPAMVRKEIWAHLLAYNLIRKIMAQAAVIYNKIPSKLSFKVALQMIEAFRQAGIFDEKNGDAYMQLLKAIAHKIVGNRPGRSEPRRVKRRPKPFPRLQKARPLYKRAV